MKNAVRDMVERMTGGNAKVAEICASTVANLEEGDVCRRLDEEEMRLLSEVPEVVRVVDGRTPVEDVTAPFVVSGDLLYTRRNWQYERNVAERIGRMAGNVLASDVTLPDYGFYALLRKEQRDAVLAMCKSQFSILTGGPGTGKTHTIARAVKYLQDTNPGLRLALAAPTGKAAARMTEAMAKAGVTAAPATTIHALMGARYDMVSFHHGRENPLSVDWLIVDEASMIGMPLMSKLLDALPDGCRLTLVGDVDQLASVERGHVFGDLCRMRGVPISRLTESTRFQPDGDIARIAAAVNGNDPAGAMAILGAGRDVVSYVDLSGAPAAAPAAWPGFVEMCRERFAAFADSRDPKTALDRLNGFRILCALRHGPYGAERLNEFVKKLLGRGCPMPMMITQNDNLQGVSNGDVGVVMPGDPQRLHLPLAERPRPIRLELLPAMELAFATTIHKSQGSEFDDVAIVLPPDGDSPLLTREILYTGITRTKGSVRIYASEASVVACCQKAVERVTGLTK
jgi:exodeoxyribonuclease V alpha subunit